MHQDCPVDDQLGGAGIGMVNEPPPIHVNCRGAIAMLDLNEVNFTRIRRIRRPSLWRRFLWWLSRHDVAICYGVMVAFSAFMVWYILDAARSGETASGVVTA